MALRKKYRLLNALEARKQTDGPSGRRGKESLDEDVIQPWAMQPPVAESLGTSLVRSTVYTTSLPGVKANRQGWFLGRKSGCDDL